MQTLNNYTSRQFPLSRTCEISYNGKTEINQRDECIFMKKRIKVVGAVIENSNLEVLCALRSPSMSLPNLWEFPGGKVEEGETPEQALVREIQEELGCAIQVYRLVEDIEHEYEDQIVNFLTYKARITFGNPNDKEHSQLKWVPIKQLDQLAWAPADQTTVRTLIDTLVEL